MATPSLPQSVPNHHVLDSARGAVRGLRQSLIEIAAATGVDLSQPQEVSRRLGLDKTLTWKIARVVRDGDIASAIEHVPGRKRMHSLVTAMVAAGASDDAAASVWKTYDEFQRLVDVHSGDRGSLDVMVAGDSDQALERRLEVHRRNAFQANAAIWGVRTRLHMGLHMMAPGQGDLNDAVTLCGFIGFHRLRANTPWAVANAVAFRTQSIPGEAPTPLHPDGLINDGPILPEFCTRPLPTMRTAAVDANNVRYELAPGPVGQDHAVDIVLGWRWPRDFSMRRTSPDEIGEHGMRLSTPAETSILDLWVHRSLEVAMNPVARVYSMLPSGPKYPFEGRDVGRLPMPDQVLDLGFGLSGATCVEYPRIAELLKFAARRMDWNPDDFRGFRYRLKHPPIPSNANLHHDLLPPLDQA